MDLALFALRVVIGLLMAGHGAQKLFGSFGGHGITGTGQFFESLGLRPGERHARLAGLGEMGGGLLLLLGLFTPLGAAAVIGVMVVAILTVHGPKGLWVTEGGYEYNLVLIAVAFALASAGPGAWSLDNAIGVNAAGAGWGLLALAAGILGGMGALISARGSGRPEPAVGPQPAPSTVPEPATDARFGRDPVEPVEPVEPLDRRR
jgi:putative oxidoreductase